MSRAAKLAAALVAIGLVGAVLLAPMVRSNLITARTGAAFIAKALCSGVLLAGMDPERLLNQELVVGRGIVETSILLQQGEVVAEALWGAVSARAMRQGDLGCSLYHAGDPPVLLPALDRPDPSDPDDTTEPWPIDPLAAPTPPELDRAALSAAFDYAFAEPDAGNPRRTRAAVVVQDGWVVAERYAPGIDAHTPMTGWSMTKSVTHALIGIAVSDGLLALDQPIPVPEWTAPDDPRRSITLDQLLRMSSGLAFSEVYDDFASDVVVMLMGARDAGGFAADKPLEHDPDTDWSYSSGTTNLIARGLRFAVNDDAAYWRFPYDRLFGPLGMHSAVIETDPSGTFVGSSMGYATARDWARFGLLYLNDGRWGDERILPEGWVEYGATPTPDSNGRYGAHWWLNRGGRYPDLPDDMYMATGFDGQRVIVVPSTNTVIVRLGQTPGSGFDPNAFAGAVLDALAAQN